MNKRESYDPTEKPTKNSLRVASLRKMCKAWLPINQSVPQLIKYSYMQSKKGQ